MERIRKRILFILRNPYQMAGQSKEFRSQVLPCLNGITVLSRFFLFLKNTGDGAQLRMLGRRISVEKDEMRSDYREELSVRMKRTNQGSSARFK